MSSEIIERLLGRTNELELAVLNGYKAYRVKDQSYPALVSEEDVLQKGLLSEELTELDK